jgi:hypothetical protein
VWLPFTRSQTHSTAPFDLIHCDVWTSPVASISGCQYYLVLLNDYSHFCWTYPLVRKSEVASIITDFVPMHTPNSVPLSSLSRLTTVLSLLTAR